MPDVLAREREFRERLTSSMSHMLEYEDPGAQVRLAGGAGTSRFFVFYLLPVPVSDFPSQYLFTASGSDLTKSALTPQPWL